MYIFVNNRNKHDRNVSCQLEPVTIVLIKVTRIGIITFGF